MATRSASIILVFIRDTSGCVVRKQKWQVCLDEIITLWNRGIEAGIRHFLSSVSSHLIFGTLSFEFMFLRNIFFQKPCYLILWKMVLKFFNIAFPGVLEKHSINILLPDKYHNMYMYIWKKVPCFSAMGFQILSRNVVLFPMIYFIW